MQRSDAARVGVTVLVAAGLLVGTTLALRGTILAFGSQEYKIPFDQARGIQEGAAVRVNGVDVGRVETVALDPQNGRPLLTLRLRGYAIQAEDLITITGGLLGFTSPNVEIIPGGRRTADLQTSTPPDTGSGAPGRPGRQGTGGNGPAAGGAGSPTGSRHARGIDPGPFAGRADPGPEQIMGQVDTLMGNLSRLTERMTGVADSVQRLVGNPEQLRGSLTRTAQNFEKVSASGLVIAQNMERSTAGVDRLVAGFQGTARRLDRTIAQADDVMAGFRGASEESRELVRDMRGIAATTQSAMEDTRGVIRNTGTVVENAGGLVTDTRAALAENRERLRELFAGINGSLKQLDATLEEARKLVGDEDARANLRATTENIREATSNLRRITDDVRGLTGDPSVQQDLRATLTGLRDATQEAADLFRRARGVLGGSAGPIRNVTRSIRETELDATVGRGIRSDRTRVDFNATIPWSDSSFYRLGLFDFGENTRFNAQVGRQIRPGVWGRYGVHASRLGLGLDFGRPQRPPFTIDLFGLDRPRVDLRGNIPVSPHLDITLGLDNATRRADPFLGLRYRR